MADIDRIAEGIAALAVAYFTHAWAMMYPLVTGLTAICALGYMIYNIIRLMWRWRHGYSNFLTDEEAKRLRAELTREQSIENNVHGSVRLVRPRDASDLIRADPDRPGESTD